MELIYRWLILMILSTRYESIHGKCFLLSDYGAYPNDDLDDTNGIQTAINDAIKSGAASEIDFGYGIYAISSTIVIENATNLTVKGQGIDQTFLIGYNPVTIFSSHNSEGLILTSFSIDYNPLPFTAGYVFNVDDNYVDVQVVPPHQTDINRQVWSILRYDPIQMRPAFGPNTYAISQHPPNDANTTIISTGILRIPLRSRTKFLKGDPVVARYATGNHAIYAQDLHDITIQSITIYTAWNMDFVTLRAKRLNVINFHVIPRNERWMSSLADCMHFADAREYVSIFDSTCHGMDNDGLNVHAVFFLVTEVIDSSTIIIQATNGTGPLEFGTGTNLEFSANKQPFSVHGNGTVASILHNSTNSRKITFTSSANISLGDWVCVGDTPMLTIRNLTVSHNRARGVLLETRNIDIRESVFNRTSGPAILIQPSMYWHEGPAARNVTLINNIYIENNEGLTQEKGIITILPDPSQITPVINDIRIESSTFYFGMYSQGLVQSNNANNVFIMGNYISTNNLTSFVSICNSRNISAENNCVVTNQTKIDQYYTFDESNPCSMNLSSLINLPTSAFNSSFPPPVFWKDSSFQTYQNQFRKRKLIKDNTFIR